MALAGPVLKSSDSKSELLGEEGLKPKNITL
jgi:hypothetical protein